jgi:hypothetical protein
MNVNAITLDVWWSELNGIPIPMVPLEEGFLSSRIGVPLREHRCPSCNSIVYTRRHGRCGVCERVLPENLLFTNDEAETIDTLLRNERQRHRAWLVRAEDRPR